MFKNMKYFIIALCSITNFATIYSINSFAAVYSMIPKKLLNNRIKIKEKKDVDILEKDIRLLKKNIANNPDMLTMQDKDGNLLLHNMVIDNNEKMVRILIISKADINARNRDGLTALHIAFKMGNLSLIELLMKKGAYMNAKDNNGRTALHYLNTVPIGKKREIVALLALNGTSINEPDNGDMTPLDLAKTTKMKHILVESLEQRNQFIRKTLIQQTKLPTDLINEIMKYVN